MKFADLHLHTIFSDGTYTPQELISESIRSGLSAIAVVDHDTVGDRARRYALRFVEITDAFAAQGGVDLELTFLFVDRVVRAFGFASRAIGAFVDDNFVSHGALLFSW